MWNKIWRWLYRQRWIFFMLALVGTTVYFGFENNDFRDAFLFDKNGKFEWIGVSAIFAGVGLYLNANLKRQEIKANIISKNELEILESFRRDCSEFSALISEYNGKMKNLTQESLKPTDLLTKEQKNKHDMRTSKMVQELNEMFHGVKQNHNLVVLDTSLYTNNAKLDFFYDDLKIVFETLSASQKEFKSGKINTTEKCEQLYNKNETLNKKFTESAKKYVKFVFEQQTNRIS